MYSLNLQIFFHTRLYLYQIVKNIMKNRTYRYTRQDIGSLTLEVTPYLVPEICETLSFESIQAQITSSRPLSRLSPCPTIDRQIF